MVAATVVSAGTGGGFVIDAGAKILAKDVAPFIAGPRRDRRLPRCRHPAAQRPPRRRRPAGGRGATGGRLDRLGRARTTSARSSTSSTTLVVAQGGRSSTRGRSTRAAGTAEALARRTQVVGRCRAGDRGSRRAARRGWRRRAGPAAAPPCSRPRSTAARRAPVRRRGSRSTRVAELREDLGRVARLGQAGDVGRGGRQRPDGRGERPGRIVVRDAQPDRRRPAGQRGRQRPTSGRCGTTTVSPPGQHASARAAAAGPITPIDAAWAARRRAAA